MVDPGRNEPLAGLTIEIRRLRDEDEAPCQGFDCGNEPHAVDVNDYIRRKRWLRGRAQEHGLIALTVPEGEIVGFGCWKHTIREREGEGPEPVIQMQYFGINLRFQGARLADGTKCADVLYATLEKDAIEHDESTPGMPIDLMCEKDNDYGIRFWQRQGFEIIDEVDGKRPSQYYLMRRTGRYSV